MADCEACMEHVSPSSALVTPHSPAVPDMLTSLEVPLSLTCRRWRTWKRECRQNEKSLQTAVIRDMPFWMRSSKMEAIPTALYLFRLDVYLSDCQQEGHASLSESAHVRSAGRMEVGGIFHLEGTLLPCARFWFIWHWWRLFAPCVIKLICTLNAPRARRQWSRAHK